MIMPPRMAKSYVAAIAIFLFICTLQFLGTGPFHSSTPSTADKTSWNKWGWSQGEKETLSEVVQPAQPEFASHDHGAQSGPPSFDSQLGEEKVSQEMDMPTYDSPVAPAVMPPVPKTSTELLLEEEEREEEEMLSEDNTHDGHLHDEVDFQSTHSAKEENPVKPHQAGGMIEDEAEDERLRSAIKQSEVEQEQKQQEDFDLQQEEETEVQEQEVEQKAKEEQKKADEKKQKEDEKKKQDEKKKSEGKKEESPSKEAWRMEPMAAVNTTFNVPDTIHYNPNGPRPDQVVIVTASDGGGHNGGIENILGQTEMNRRAYCEHHGYNYHFVNISKFDLGSAHPVWKKIPAIVDAFNTFPEAHWVFFLDLDAIIMTPNQDLNSLVLSRDGMGRSLDFGTEFHASNRKHLGVYMPRQEDTDFDNIDMLVSQDHNGINAGSFFLRRSKFTQWMLDMWADPFFMTMEWPGKEQDTLLHFIKHHKTFRKHVGLIRQRVANAYTEGGPSMGWYTGDLVVHFAGCWVNDKCQERWQTFWSKRGTLEH